MAAKIAWIEESQNNNLEKKKIKPDLTTIEIRNLARLKRRRWHKCRKFQSI